MGGAVLKRWRRYWASLSGVERIALYTRQSLYGVLWLFNGSTLAGGAVRLGDAEEAAVLLAGGVAVTGLGHATLLADLRRHPAVRPLPWRSLGPLLVVSAAYLPLVAGDGRGTATLVVIVTFALSLGVLPDNRLSAGLLAGAALVFGIAAEHVAGAVAGLLAAGGALFTARVSMWVLGIVAENDAARQAQTRLALVEERLRFSRDVHDVLGRRLSTIAVQAELAATLAERGDERAAARMLEVRGVAHDALREARELARGYRSTDFAQELEGARSLLRSAGIEVELEVGAMPRAWHEAAAWVVRESVTNVLRHSSAGRVEIAYADEQLRVENDGVRGAGSADGSGLRGLRERLAPLGARLSAEPDGEGRWAVVAHLPGSGPLSAGGAR